jgi:hypothetical protein
LNIRVLTSGPSTRSGPWSAPTTSCCEALASILYEQYKLVPNWRVSPGWQLSAAAFASRPPLNAVFASSIELGYRALRRHACPHLALRRLSRRGIRETDHIVHMAEMACFEGTRFRANVRQETHAPAEAPSITNRCSDRHTIPTHHIELLIPLSIDYSSRSPDRTKIRLAMVYRTRVRSNEHSHWLMDVMVVIAVDAETPSAHVLRHLWCGKSKVLNAGTRPRIRYIIS